MKTLREQIQEIMTYCTNYARNWDENAAMGNYPTPQEVEIDKLLDLIREHDKRVIGEDEAISDELIAANLWPGKQTKNQLKSEQRKRSEEELK